MNATRRILALTATALAIGATTSYATAATPAADAPAAMQGAGPNNAEGGAKTGAHHWHHHWHHRAGRRGDFLAHLNRLHDQLNLNPQQQQLWDTARNMMRQNASEMRTNGHQRMGDMRKLIEQPVIDFGALRDAHEQDMQHFQQMHKQTEDAWLNVYNALNDTQKKIVSDDFRAHLKHAAAFRHRHDMRSQRHGTPAHPGSQPSPQPAPQPAS